MDPPIIGRCPWCGRELAVFVDEHDVDISHAEPECARFVEFCRLEGFEIVGLADAIRQSR